MNDSPQQHGLAGRNALLDWDDVATDLIFEGRTPATPLATIAITTFKRPELLIEAVRSAIGQDFARPFQVLVFDNDAQNPSLEALRTAVPEIAEKPFRYYLHRDNIGIFGNMNRCILRADTPWLSILSDDDLLDRDFLTTMFSAIDREPSIDAIMSRKRVLDQRAGSPSDRKRSLPWHVAKRLSLEYNYLLSTTRRIRPSLFFFGAVLGNPAGFLFKRECAKTLGGFIPEEFPASDMWLLVRFAKQYDLRQHREVKATMGVAENETAKRDTVEKGLVQGFKVQEALLREKLVPAWWRRLRGLLLEQHRIEFRDFWGTEIPKERLEALLGMPLPRERRVLLRGIQAALRGL